MALTNDTLALNVALRALGVGLGDEVVVTCLLLKLRFSIESAPVEVGVE